MTTEHKSSAELRIELAAAEQRERAEKQTRLQTVPVLYRYTVTPNTRMRLYDDTCRAYRLQRHTLNAEEAKAAGHSDWEVQEGGMTYIYNTMTQAIVCSVGGGTSYIGGSFGPDSGDSLDWHAFTLIGRLIAEHPDGCEATEIIEQYQAARRALKNK